MTDQQGIEIITQALRAFVRAETWAESKRIVEAQSALLLTDEADFVLTIFLQHSADDQEALRNLEAHRELLQRCRAEGIEAAFAERLDSATTSDIPSALMARLAAVRSEAELEQLLDEHPELLPVLMQMQNAGEENPQNAQPRLPPLMQALIDCDNPQAVLILVSKQPDLLSDEMEALLQQFISQARAQGDAEGDGMAQLVEERLTTLRQLREIMRERKMPPAALEQAALLQSIDGFVNTSNWLEARFYVQEHPELLSDEVDSILAEMIRAAQREGKERMAHHLQEHHIRLARARQEGLDTIASA